VILGGRRAPMSLDAVEGMAVLEDMVVLVAPVGAMAALLTLVGATEALETPVGAMEAQVTQAGDMVAETAAATGPVPVPGVMAELRRALPAGSLHRWAACLTPTPLRRSLVQGHPQAKALQDITTARTTPTPITSMVTRPPTDHRATARRASVRRRVPRPTPFRARRKGTACLVEGRISLVFRPAASIIIKGHRMAKIRMIIRRTATSLPLRLGEDLGKLQVRL